MSIHAPVLHHRPTLSTPNDRTESGGWPELIAAVILLSVSPVRLSTVIHGYFCWKPSKILLKTFVSAARGPLAPHRQGHGSMGFARVDRLRSGAVAPRATGDGDQRDHRQDRSPPFHRCLLLRAGPGVFLDIETYVTDGAEGFMQWPIGRRVERARPGGPSRPSRRAWPPREAPRPRSPGRNGDSSRTRSRTGSSSRSAFAPIPPPRITRAGSSTAATAAIVMAIRSASWATTFFATRSPFGGRGEDPLAGQRPGHPGPLSRRRPHRRRSPRGPGRRVCGSRGRRTSVPHRGRYPTSPAAPPAPR